MGYVRGHIHTCLSSYSTSRPKKACRLLVIFIFILIVGLTAHPVFSFLTSLLPERLRSLATRKLKVDLIPQLICGIPGKESTALVVDHLDQLDAEVGLLLLLKLLVLGLERPG